MDTPKLTINEADLLSGKVKVVIAKAEDNHLKNLMITVNGKPYTEGQSIDSYQLKGFEGRYVIKVSAVDKSGKVTEKIITIGNFPELSASLRKTSFQMQDLTSIDNLLSLAHNQTAELIKPVQLMDKKVSFTAKISDPLGRSVVREFEALLSTSNLKVDSKLKPHLKKQTLLLTDPKGITDLFDLDKDSSILLTEIVDNKVGNHTIKGLIFKNGAYNHFETSIQIVKTMEEINSDRRLKNDHKMDKPQVIAVGMKGSTKTPPFVHSQMEAKKTTKIPMSRAAKHELPRTSDDNNNLLAKGIALIVIVLGLLGLKKASKKY
ncbi:TPA: LPXTG cell wall anchor domain-containing protein [Streptococcus agalactiae]